MPPTTKFKGNLGGIYLWNPAPGNQIDPVLHLGKGKYDIEVFHLHKFLNQDGEITYISIGFGLGYDHLDTIDAVSGG